MVSRTERNIDGLLIGENASTEGLVCKSTKSTIITCIDNVMIHHWQETSFTKEACEKYFKDYMKLIKVKPFMAGASEQIKKILANFKNYQFFIGENMNPYVMVALLDYSEDGVISCMYDFLSGKHCF
uniref:Translationally-controlled tumor protein n=1 Tax=Felis catus TaxID=9685 RepID=A0ABI7VTN1_FELCA